MAISLDEFVARLAANDLLRADDVATICNEIGRDSALVADHLVQEGLLTRYQAHALLQPTCEPLVLGDYVIFELVGQGGMGKVFKAEHRHMERVVALKMLPVDDSHDAEAVGRFEREIKAAARLVHPNIVTAYDARIENDTRYLVCEFIDGIDLSSLVKRDGPLDVRTAVNYVIQAARGLDHSHQKKIVHRDVKPSNLMLAESGEVKVLDLGLAQFATLFGSGDVISTVSELTGAGQVVGTIDYMAPEQAIDCRAVDSRADIYSLGCTLYYLLAGQPPFNEGSTVERLMAHQQQDFPSICNVRSRVPDQLEDVLRQMVARSPNDRIPNMSDVIRLLEDVDRELATHGDGEPVLEAQRETGQYNAVTANLEEPVETAPPQVTLDRTKVNRQATQVHGPTTTDDSSRDAGAPRNRWGAVLLVAVALCCVLAMAFSQYVGQTEDPPQQSTDDSDSHGSGMISNGAKADTVDAKVVPPPDVAPITPPSTRETQAACAKRLGVPVSESPFSDLSLVLIPPGKLSLGEQAVRATDQPSLEFGSKEQTPRTGSLKVAQPFYCATREISRQQFSDVLGFDPSTSLGLDESKSSKLRPVETVTWQDAIRFCNELSRKCGLNSYYEVDGSRISIVGGVGFRLPTEDEWEYACRAGATTKFSFGNKFDDLYEHGWFGSNSMNRTQPVGSKKPNPFGLYDMHGNVWEWCEDLVIFKPNVDVRINRRIVRGGSWMHDADQCGSASRSHYGDTDKGRNGGFRVVRTMISPSGTVAPLDK